MNAVLPALQRTQLRQFHDGHLHYRLMAMIPSTVNLARGIAQRTLVSQLYAANTRGNFGQDLIRRLLEDTERMTYNGGHKNHVRFRVSISSETKGGSNHPPTEQPDHN
jgi:hypothetical protein